MTADQAIHPAGMEDAPQASAPAPQAAPVASPSPGAATPPRTGERDMSTPDLDNVVRQLAARGVRVLEDGENTPEMVIGIIREQRRRHASRPRTRAMNSVAARLADDLVAETGVEAADIARVLVALATRLGSLAVGHGVPGPMLCELIGFAADDCDRQAKGEQQEPRTP